jgi:hypothetical protein
MLDAHGGFPGVEVEPATRDLEVNRGYISVNSSIMTVCPIEMQFFVTDRTSTWHSLK